MSNPVLTEDALKAIEEAIKRDKDEITVLREWLSDIKNKAEGLEQARHWASCAIVDADEIKEGETSLNKDRKP